MRTPSGAALVTLAIGAAVLLLVALVLAPREPAGSPDIAASPTATPVSTQTVAGQTASPVPTVTPDRTAGSTAGPKYESALGYSVVLPEGWRRSDLRSRTSPDPRGDPELLAFELFTARTPEDERARYERCVNTTGLCDTDAYSAFVSIYRNSDDQTPRGFAEDQQHALGLRPESIQDITYGGRPAARTTWSWDGGKTSFATYVEDDEGRMWVVGFYLGWSFSSVPPGADEADLREIVGSFSAPWLR